MARIRKIEIQNYRGIKQFSWLPSAGINCLIGPGDSGKSSVLDAIDVCLGARRNVQFSDADFHKLDVAAPISISLTIGELDDALKSMETYGMSVRGFDRSTGAIDDEPEKDAETVLTLNLTVASDLEPSWTLVSDRASAQNQTPKLTWADRVRLAPTRLGTMAEYNLGWRHGSVLNRLSDKRSDASDALVRAAREARGAFGNEAEKELGETLAMVAKTAKSLGVPVGDQARAMLDAHSVSFSTGTIALHDEGGVPLRGLGVGSARLLVAGLQRMAADKSTIILVDELEYGLEPHRIMRLLASLGAKEKKPPLQAFVATHSPVAVRELSANQLFVMRQLDDSHEARSARTDGDIQTTIRLFPEAFLAPAVIVCEGDSEVGFVRGLDHHRTADDHTAISALGVALVSGGGVDQVLKRAHAFRALGYRVAVIRDDDKRPPEADERAFKDAGGKVISWRNGRALEDELFLSLSDDGVDKLIRRATALHGEGLINDHIISVSQNAKDLAAIQKERQIGGISPESRAILGSAASRKAAWFKTLISMEAVAYDIVGPDLHSGDAGFRAIIDHIFEWCAIAGE